MARKNTFWKVRARACAEIAHEEHLASRQGILLIDGHDVVVCLYSNHPYADFPALRGAEMRKLEERLAAVGIAHLASATYLVGARTTATPTRHSSAPGPTGWRRLSGPGIRSLRSPRPSSTRSADRRAETEKPRPCGFLPGPGQKASMLA